MSFPMSSFMQQCTKFLIRETRSVHTCSALNAARKGTRAKRNAKKKASKKEEIKKMFIPYKKILEMKKVGTISPRIDDSHRPIAIDDVYITGLHRIHNYSLADTVVMHRETAEPCQFNKPNGPIIAKIEMSMSADKKDKYLSGFSNIVLLPFPYAVSHRRTLIALCKDEEMVNDARAMNVDLALGPEFQSLIEKGDLDFKLYDNVIAHSSLLPNLVPFRNILKKKMPSIKEGTAGITLEPLIKRFIEGIKYEVIVDKYDYDFASVKINLGLMIWESEHLEANLETILIDIEQQRLVKMRSKSLITKVTIECEHTREKFQVDYKKYFPENEPEKDLDVGERYEQ